MTFDQAAFERSTRGDQKTQSGWDDPTGPSRGPRPEDIEAAARQQSMQAHMQGSCVTGTTVTTDMLAQAQARAAHDAMVRGIQEQQKRAAMQAGGLYPAPRPASTWLIMAAHGDEPIARPVMSSPDKATAEKIHALILAVDPNAKIVMHEVPVW